MQCGLNLNNIEMLKKCDIDGYAVVSAILKVEDIKSECEKWIDAINI